MFKKLFYGCLGPILVLFLNGCLESKSSLPAALRDYSLSPFIGSWTTESADAEPDTDYLAVFHEEDAGYLTAVFADKKAYEPTAEALAEARSDEDAEIYHITFSMLAGKMFANVFMLESKEPNYVILKVAMNGPDMFRSWQIKDESIKAASDAQKISQEGTAVIALEPERLAEFVALFKDEDYQETSVFQRVK